MARMPESSFRRRLLVLAICCMSLLIVSLDHGYHVRWSGQAARVRRVDAIAAALHRRLPCAACYSSPQGGHAATLESRKPRIQRPN